MTPSRPRTSLRRINPLISRPPRPRPILVAVVDLAAVVPAADAAAVVDLAAEPAASVAVAGSVDQAVQAASVDAVAPLPAP